MFRPELDYRDGFFSKLSGFRVNGMYSDVTIECGTKSFRCHRLILAATSEYFEAMFGCGFKENAAENIVLHDVDATTFDSVLQFLYSGKLVIDAGNIYDLIKASDFIGIKGLEHLCVRFVAENRQTLNVLELHLLAQFLKNEVLIDLLGRCDMTQQLEEYFKSDAYLGLPFDVFASIVKRWNKTSQDAIVRWTNSSTEMRKQHFDELVTIHAESVIPDFGTSLYVHVMYDRGMDMEVKTFVIDQSQPRICSPLSDLEVKLENVTQQHVTLDNRLFYLSHRYEDVDFILSESVDMRPASRLKPPPVIGSDFILTNMPNHGIYMYDRSLCGEPNRYVADMTPEEISRGIVLYNYDVNKWFHVPPMSERQRDACMTVLNNMLYLIGGKKTRDYVQAHDPRTGKWLRMPKTKFDHSEASCCTSFNDTIYVCGGGKSKKKAERLNVVAGKWESIPSLPTGLDDYEAKLVPYANCLWLFENSYRSYLPINVYDPVPNSWREVRSTSTGRFVGELVLFGKIGASFVFNSL